MPKSYGAWLVWGYGAFVMFCQTLGPVYRVRTRMTRVNGEFIDDQLISLWFLGLYAVAFCLLARNGSTARRRPLVMGALGALIIALALSGVWSQVESRTFSQVILFAGTSVFAVWVAERFTARQIAWMLFASMQAGALLGTWAVQRHWYQTLSKIGDWEGIYFNRNSFAPVAALGLAAGLVVLAGEIRNPNRREAIAAAVVVLACGVVDVIVLQHTNSATSLVGLAAFVWTFLLWLVLREVGRRGVSAPWLCALFVAISSLAAAAAWFSRTWIADLLGREVGLTRRRELWDVVIDWWRHQPIGGLGWQSPWVQSRFQEDVIAATGGPLPNAHNAYLEVLMGAGLIGFAALGVLLAVALWRNGRIAATATSPFTLVFPAMLAYGLVVNTQELFITGNVVVWTLIVVAAVHPSGDTPAEEILPDDGASRPNPTSPVGATS